MEQPIISVIVPVYKTEQYLNQCVKSILSQTYKSLEVILIDDGSPDNCPRMCDEFARKDDRIKVIHQKNGGLAKARNEALEICTGEYIAFVDSDDWIEKNAYAIMMDMMLKRNLDAVFCTANIIIENRIAETRFHYFQDGEIKTPQEIVDLTLSDAIGGQVWLKLFSKKCWNAVRFPEGRLYEDLAISFLPFTYAKKGIGFISKPLYNYRMNTEGISLSGKPLRQYHIFLAFLDHYNFTKVNDTAIKQKCLANAAIFGIGCYDNWLRFRYAEGSSCLPTVHRWLTTNKKAILRCSAIPCRRMMMLRLYYFSKPLYKALYYIFAPR